MSLIAYPIEYIIPVRLSDGTILQLRPIHPSDGRQADQFKSMLSSESIYNRFFGYIPEQTEDLVKRLTVIDYSKEMAIVAEDKNGNEKEIVAVARIVPDKNNTTEFAIIIADHWHRKGLGGTLTKLLITVAKDLGYQTMVASVLSHNVAMLEILRHRGFDLQPEDGQTILAKLKL